MLDVFLVFLFIFCNGFFVAAEFAFVRVRASQLEILRDEGSRPAGRVLKILEHVDSYLSAVQLGITFASLGIGWLAEPAINRYFLAFVNWANIPMTEEFSHYISAPIAFILASFLHIVLGEIVPKSLAIAKPLEISQFVSLPMRIFHWIFNPVMFLLTATTNGILKLIHVEPVQAGHSTALSADEIRNIAQHSSEDGTITKAEGNLLDKVFHFSSLNAKDVMVPRGNIQVIKVDESLDSVIAFALEQGHSRYPLVQNGLDDIVGVIHIKDLIAAHMRHEENVDLRNIARPVIYIPETATVSQALEKFQQKHFHLGIVVDEYGGTSGMLTVEDVLEEIVGEIEDEFDAETSQNIREENGVYHVKGTTLLSELCEYLDLDEIEAESDTISGFIMEKLGRVAKLNDEVKHHNLTFKVTAMQRLRIEEVLVTIEKTEEDKL